MAAFPNDSSLTNRLPLAQIMVVCLQLSCATVRDAPSASGLVRVEQQAGKTRWILTTSEAFDAICFLNLLRGDPFYEPFVPPELARYRAKLGSAETGALQHLTARMQTQAKSLIPAKLTLVFSAERVETLADLVEIASSDPAWARLKRDYLGTSYGAGDDFAEIDDVRPDLQVLFRFLDRSGFSRDWRETAAPAIEQYLRTSLSVVDKFDVIGADEEVLGRRLGTGDVTAIVLKYVKPHGIRLIGWRFLTDVSWPLNITVKTALHELLHPPFDRRGALARGLSELEQDPFYQHLLKDHDPSFGYTTAEGLTEEDCAEAIDVFNSERLGLLRTSKGIPIQPANYFREHDQGLHVLAFILYQELKRSYPLKGTTFEEFLLGLMRDGKLRAGSLRGQFESYPDHYELGWTKPDPPGPGVSGG